MLKNFFKNSRGFAPILALIILAAAAITGTYVYRTLNPKPPVSRIAEDDPCKTKHSYPVLCNRDSACFWYGGVQGDDGHCASLLWASKENLNRCYKPANSEGSRYCYPDQTCSDSTVNSYCKPQGSPPGGEKPPAQEPQPKLPDGECATNNDCVKNNSGTQQICINAHGTIPGRCIDPNSRRSGDYCDNPNGIPINFACNNPAYCDPSTLRCGVPPDGQTGGCKNDDDCKFSSPDKPYCVESGPSLGTCQGKVSSGDICKGVDGKAKPVCPTGQSCNASNDTFVCTPSSAPKPPARITPPAGEKGFCAYADRSNPKGTVCKPNTFDSSGDEYCRSEYKDNNLYWLKCTEQSKPGDTTLPVPGHSSAEGICEGLDGPSGSYPGGYFAPICMDAGKTPTDSNFREGIFNADSAKKREYENDTYYDVFACKKTGTFDFANKTVKGVCDKYPWTPLPDGKLPTPPDGQPGCSDPAKPYWDGSKCTYRPGACNNIGPSGKTNVCQTTACSTSPDLFSGEDPKEANLACKTETGKDYCCGVPSQNTPTPGGGQTPPGSGGGTPPQASPSASIDGKVCEVKSDCRVGGSNDNECTYGWDNTVTKYCCGPGKSWCVTKKICVGSHDECIAPRSTPPQYSRLGLYEKCYIEDVGKPDKSQCDVGLSCRQVQGTSKYRCESDNPGNTPQSLCDSSKGLICVVPKAVNGNYLGSEYHCSNDATPKDGYKYYGSGPADTACSAAQGQTTYCCAPKSTSSTPPGGGSTQPPSGGTAPVVPPPPAGFLSQGESCTTPDKYLGGTYCVGGRQVDVYCRDNIVKYEDIGLACTTASLSTSSRIASQNTCLTSLECATAKLGNVCVFYKNSDFGVCKAY